MLDPAVAIPTLVGSALSMTAAGFVFLCYLLFPSQLHFRHTLIINLATAGAYTCSNSYEMALIPSSIIYQRFE